MEKTRQSRVAQDTSSKKKCLQNTETLKSKITPSRNKSAPNKLVKKASLNEEMQYVHLTVDSFRCDKCYFKCKRIETLDQHKTCHDKEPFPILTCYPCNFCNKKFRKLSTLHLHETKAHKLRPTTENFYKPQETSEDVEKLLKPNITPCTHDDYKKITTNKPLNSPDGCEPQNKSDNDSDSLNVLDDGYIMQDNNMPDVDYKILKPDTKKERAPTIDKTLLQQNPEKDYEKLLKPLMLECTMKMKTLKDSTDTKEKAYSVKDSLENSKSLVAENCLQNKTQIKASKASVSKKSFRKTESEGKVKKNTTTIKKKCKNPETQIILLKSKEIEIKRIIEEIQNKNILKIVKIQNREKQEIVTEAKIDEIQNTTTQKRMKRQKRDVNHEFVCTVCSYKTRKKPIFTAHMVKHSGQQPFTCNQCTFKTCWRNALSKHLITHGQEKPHACDLCDYKSHQLCNLQRHLKIHNKHNLICVPCKINFKDTVEQQSHNEICHIHQDGKAEPDRFKCDKCDFETEHASILELHSKTHIKQLLSCDACCYRTSSSVRLTNHIRKHDKNMPFSCTDCNFKCKRSETLESHMQSHETSRVVLKSYTCDICDKKFRNHSRFQMHKTMHNCKNAQSIENLARAQSETKFELCDLCDYKCKRKYDLVQHKRKHTGEKPYKCEYCPHRASTSSHLIVHMRRHTGEKQYICNLCGYGCLQSGLLQRHMQHKHKGLEPYNCDLCNMKFKISYNLTCHKKTEHANDKRMAK